MGNSLGLFPFQNRARLLKLFEFALLVSKNLAQLGHALFLLGDLFEENFDGCSFDPGFTSRGLVWYGC